jgi:DNA gyrase subunit A
MYTRNEKVVNRDIGQEIKTSYINYAMSVIVGRALPDVRDGLKPVHRRIIYTMDELSLRYNKPRKKSARIVGDAMGKYHPHGDSAIYDSLVRMVQSFSLRYPLVDGQGNFGCFTGDTKIKLVDGTTKTFKELSELPEKASFDVYSVNGQKRIVIGKGSNARVTRRKAQLMEVTLDNKVKVRCTPDHRFLLRNGTYKEAQDLTPDDSLMAGYFDLAPVREKKSSDYLRVKQHDGSWTFVHWLADEYNLRIGRYNRSAGRIRHHIDLNRFNNSTDNIECLSFREHHHKSNRTGNWIPRYEKAVKYFDGPKHLDSVGAQNHRIISTRYLTEREDVYDLTVDEHHNFLLDAGVFVHNSVDGDSAAAMRYTEAKLDRITDELLEDIDKDTVRFVPNYDESLKEPTVLPARLPNLLINGTGGIAVGMATNIPPHHLGEICDGVIAVVDKPDISVKELNKIVKGPDFPTGGIICGRDGIRSAYETGRGRLIVRARSSIEEQKGNRESIIIREIPYQVNKANLITSIAELVTSKRIEGISDIRDESDREGMRVVIELKRDSNAQIILNQLYKRTQMQETFGVIMLALVNNRPKVLNLRQMFDCFLAHREEVITRRTRFLLAQAERRAHILEGFKIAQANINKIVQTIRQSKGPEEAKIALMKTFKLSEIQAKSILEMQLQRITKLERHKIEEEYLEVIKRIELYKSILKSRVKILKIVKDETLEIKKRYGDERRTQILAKADDFEVEDLIAEENVVITVSRKGYIKRMPITTYRQQRRGGKGVTSGKIREEDFIEHLFVASTHEHMLFFTDQGRVHQLRVFEIPQASRQAKGKAIVNLLQIQPGETVTSVVPVKEFNDSHYIVMATRKGIIKKSLLSLFSRPRKGGIVAITLDKGDGLIETELTDGNQELLIATRKGQACRFKESNVRVMGRTARGVRGIRLGNGDKAISMCVSQRDTSLLTITSKGRGKRSRFEDYRLTSRGGKGVRNIQVNAKNGEAVDSKTVHEDDELVIITTQGMTVRCAIKDIRIMGRGTQGVRLISLSSQDRVAAVARIQGEDEEEA